MANVGYTRGGRALTIVVALTDEIALNFDDVFQSLDKIAALHQFSAAQIALLTRIDAIFAHMSAGDHASFWTRDALHDDADWQNIRAFAQKALHALYQPVGPPHLYWLQYVAGR